MPIHDELRGLALLLTCGGIRGLVGSMIIAKLGGGFGVKGAIFLGATKSERRAGQCSP